MKTTIPARLLRALNLLTTDDQLGPQGAPWFELSLPVIPPVVQSARESPPLLAVVKLPDITPVFTP